ncbi:hypothetical protein CIB48_g3365 [Xylaria polymorpha]|nr:hypothetical protein CIB48_g3365 [Xylaria polymorpha]
MSLALQFLTSIRGFLKSRNGIGLRDWLRVEPPLPQQYLDFATELKNGYRNANGIAKLVEKCLPEEDDLPEDQGTAWPGFIAFVKDYFEYWRDVNFDDLLGAHQLLMGLTNSCTTALNHPTYGTIMLQTSISLCGSLSKLSMTLNKRPDLTKKLDTLDTGEDDQTSIVGTTAEVIQKIFTTCLTDRSSQRYAHPEGKKIGVYIFANLTLKLLFACRKTHLAKQLFTNVSAKAPPLSFYPAGQRVTYLYYLGRFHFINNHFTRASRCLEEAYIETPSRFQKHRQLILTYLVPCNMLLGRLPSQTLLQRPEMQSMALIFSQFAQAIRTGNYLIFQQALESHNDWLLRKGLLLTLTYRVRPLLWRSLSRRTFLLTYVAPTEADSRKAATLELSHLLITAAYIQKRLEGYLPSNPEVKRKQLHINNMFLKAVSNSAGSGTGISTLAPPPGGPKLLRPNEGLVWGNMAITAEHIESMVASLCAQGLLHGYVAHSQGRFAIMGAKQKGSAVGAGWPSVYEVLTRPDDEIPGWVKDQGQLKANGTARAVSPDSPKITSFRGRIRKETSIRQEQAPELFNWHNGMHHHEDGILRVHRRLYLISTKPAISVTAAILNLSRQSLGQVYTACMYKSVMMKVVALLLSSASLGLAVSRTSPPSGCVHVAKSGGSYTTVQSALNSLSTTSTADQCIFINQGTYTEQVYIPSRAAKLTIYGYTSDSTSYANNKAIITYNLPASTAGSNDASGTLRVHAANVKVYNVNIMNSYGKGSQAIALSAQADSGYYGCQLYGFQDTLLANEGKQYYSRCLITGATDFIFGQRAQVWFEDCDIRVRNGGYYITANGRDSSSNPSYYLFNNCDVAAASGESVSTVFQSTSLSSVINGAGWHDWNGDTDVGNIYYAEYANSGSGASGTRVSWSKKLSSAVSQTNVLGSGYTSGAWYDGSYPN